MRHLHWLIPLVVAWIFWCTLQATSWDHIRTLGCIENYALAVYEQLVWNHAHTGKWVQTIHFGYVDHWMWSGHRSLWIWVVSWIYGMAPEALTLTRIQIGAVALGALPAWGLGRHVFRTTAPGWRAELQHLAGGLIGLTLYLAFPPLTAVALNDYQDLVLGTPFAVAAIWASRVGSLPGFVLAAFGCCCAREEWAVVMPFIGLGYPGPVRERLKQVGWGVGTSFVWGMLIYTLGRDFKGHDNPMASHVGGFLSGLPTITRTPADFQKFYVYFLLPLQILGLLSPITAFPAAGSLFFHLTAPPFGGVDTQWKGHIHHMAPVCAFVSAASIEGLGWLFRKTPLRERSRPVLAGVLSLVVLAVSANAYRPWISYMELQPALTPALRTNPPDAAEWTLLASLPAEAVIATDVHCSLAVSNRHESYTYDESLHDKRPGKELSIVDYLLVKKVDREWQQKARAVPGAEKVGETEKYLLYYFPRAGSTVQPPEKSG